MPTTPMDATPFVPDTTSLKKLAAAVDGCRGCPLYANATQGVFGEGKKGAPLMFVGEQPGDEEDKNGRPFVGPSGRMLNGILDEIGLDRTSVYVTNAVKHFKFVQRGKRRLHSKPAIREVNACRPWLEAEVARAKPKLIVALGATAARSLLGAKFQLTRQRGEVHEGLDGVPVLATYHPSAILRADAEGRARMRKAIADDLRVAAEHLRG